MWRKLEQTFQYMLLLRGATDDWDVFPRQLEFQYMLLLRGATSCKPYTCQGCGFQYMLLLRGATGTLMPSLKKPRGFNTCSSCEEQLPARML